MEEQNCIRSINICNKIENLDTYNNYKVITDIIAQIGHNSLFKSLRTEKMVGYVVALGNKAEKGQIMLKTLAQGGKYTVDEMKSLEYDWKQGFAKEIQELDVDDLEQVKYEIANSYMSKFAYLKDKHE